MNSPFCGVCYKPIPADQISIPLETVNCNGMLLHKKCCICCCCHKPTIVPHILFCGIYCPECFEKVFSTPGFKMANDFCHNLWNGWHCSSCMTQFLQNFMKSTMRSCTPNFGFPTPYQNFPQNVTGQSSGPSPPPPCPNPSSSFTEFANVNPMSPNSQPSGPQNCNPQIYFSSPWVNII